MTTRFASFLWLAITINALLLVACSKMDPNPELKDPIYKEIENEIKNLSKTIIDTEKTLETLIAEQSKLTPRTKERMVNLRDIQKQKAVLEISNQRLAYQKIRLERRKIKAKADYSKAFEEKQPWPDPKEYENYKAMQKLQRAPRNWDHRVPKLKNDKFE